jgi:hypothetical protein
MTFKFATKPEPEIGKVRRYLNLPVADTKRQLRMNTAAASSFYPMMIMIRAALPVPS